MIKPFKWDFKIGDTIDYFDPFKSYEISHYRPINDTDGLDFKPEWFQESGARKLKTNKYSTTIYGTPSYRKFWDEEKLRCIEGFEVNGYRLTGDNYFWINFYRLKTSKKGAKASAGRDLSFPKFLVFQYEFFHYVEICELLGKDVGLLKARALGYSEMGACLCVRPFITTPNYRVMASAFSEKHLKPLLAKAWSQLDWLASETEGAFRRVRMVQNSIMHKRASKKLKDNSEAGHMSEIEGIVADSPEKIRGDRVERLLMEEAGSDKVFKEKYLQGEALITVLGGDRVGTRIAWGTGGDKGSSLAGIKDLILKPDVYNVLKFRHNYTPNRKYILTGMFIPATRMVTKLLDSRGWCNREAAEEYYKAERVLKAADPKALLIYSAEFCFTIEEALIQQGDNIFPREEIAEQIAQYDIYQTIKEPELGALTWTRDTQGTIIGVKWRKDSTGNILISEHPLISPEKTSYKNLYVGGIDSIDIGAAETSSDNVKKVSDFCIVIKKRILGLNNPRYVALYKERPRDIRDAYENAAKLLTYYGCQAVLEATRTAITTYFRDKGFITLLMKRPRSTMPDITKGNSNMIGTPATTKVITHYRELIYDFCLDYCFTIEFREMLEQLLNYSDEKKKEFDIIAALGMCELGDEEMSLRKPEAREPEGKKFVDIGWFKDGKGYRHFGKIPQNMDERNAQNRIRTSDSWLYKELL